MDENITFSTQISEQDLYNFNIHHAYRSSQGIVSVIVSLLLIAVWGMRYQSLTGFYRLLYPLVAILFCMYLPMSLKMRAKAQMRQEVFMHPLNYTLKEEGLVIVSPAVEEPADLPWQYIYKVSLWNGYLLIYSSRINAYIIPVSDIEDKKDQILAFIKSHVEDYKYTIK